MPITWPATLPAPLNSGYGYQPLPTVAKTEMATGRMRQRQLYADPPADLNINWKMLRGQFTYFEAWWEEALLSGSLPFEIELDSGAGITPHTVTFDSAYRVQRAGPVVMMVSATLRIHKVNRLDLASAAIAADYEAQGESYSAFIDRLDLLVNTELPANTAFDPEAA